LTVNRGRFPSPTYIFPLPEGGGGSPLYSPLRKRRGLRWGSFSQSSPFPLGRGRTKVGDRNFLPQFNPLLVFLPLKKGEEIKEEGRGGLRWGRDY